MKTRSKIATGFTATGLIALTTLMPAAAGVFGYSQRAFGCWLFPALC